MRNSVVPDQKMVNSAYCIWYVHIKSFIFYTYMYIQTVRLLLSFFIYFVRSCWAPNYITNHLISIKWWGIWSCEQPFDHLAVLYWDKDMTNKQHTWFLIECNFENLGSMLELFDLSYIWNSTEVVYPNFASPLLDPPPTISFEPIYQNF